MSRMTSSTQEKKKRETSVPTIVFGSAVVGFLTHSNVNDCVKSFNDNAPHIVYVVMMSVFEQKRERETRASTKQYLIVDLLIS